MRAASRCRPRAGFTLLEAAVALSIVGLAGIAALEAFGTELRTGERVQRALARQSLAEARVAVLSLTPASSLERLPDSLSRGRFAAPFERTEWTATARRVQGVQNLFSVEVHVSDDRGTFTLGTRLHRPPSSTERP